MSTAENAASASGITTLELERGALCISIDLELAWGTWDHQTAENHRLCALHERDIVTSLLALFAKHETPVTWAIVGRLLDEDDARSRPGGASNWYAPEVIARIREARPAHEIGSHSYAHVYYPELTADEAERDLANARRVHERAGLALRSFVFPRNQVGHVELLARHGISVYRSVDVGPLHTLGRALPRLRAATNFADKLLPTAPSLVRPKRYPGGLVEIETSLLLMGRNGPRRFIPPSLWRRRMHIALQHAALQHAVFHLWFHPSNFYFEADTQLAILDALLAEAAAMRAEKKLDVRTMESFGERADERAAV